METKEGQKASREETKRVIEVGPHDQEAMPMLRADVFYRLSYWPTVHLW